METNTQSGSCFPVIDIDGSLGIVQSPCESNGHRPNVIARFPNTEEGQRRLDKMLDKLPHHVWL